MKLNITRRTAMIGAAGLAAVAATSVNSGEIAEAAVKTDDASADAPREDRAGRAAVRASARSGRQERPGDQGIHAHRAREEDRRRRRRHHDASDDLQRLGPGPADGRARGRLCRTHAGQPGDQHVRAQYRPACLHRRAGRRRAHPCQPRRAGHPALQSHAPRRVRLSLRARRPDDPVARRQRHERRGHGAAARRAEGRQRQAAALRPRLLCRRERLLHSARRERQVQELRRRRCLSGQGS